MKTGINIEGRIQSLSVENKEGVVKENLSFDNHILRNNLIGSSGGLPKRLEVLRVFFGTGTAPDSPDHLGLTSPDELYWGLQVTDHSVKDKHYDPLTRSRSMTYVLEYRSTTAGYYAGTWTEMGLGDDISTNFSMSTRTLIKDSTGNPTSITVLDDEYISVIYEITITHKFEETTGILSAGGINYNYKLMNVPYLKDESMYTRWLSSSGPNDSSGNFGIYLLGRNYSNVFGIEYFPSIATWENHISDPVWVENNKNSREDYRINSYPSEETFTNTGPQSFNISFAFLPQTFDERIAGICIGDNDTEDMHFFIAFDEPVIKPGNEKLTVSIDITWSIQ